MLEIRADFFDQPVLLLVVHCVLVRVSVRKSKENCCNGSSFITAEVMLNFALFMPIYTRKINLDVEIKHEVFFI